MLREFKSSCESLSAVGEKVFLFPSLAEQVRLRLNSSKVKQSVGVGVA